MEGTAAPPMTVVMPIAACDRRADQTPRTGHLISGFGQYLRGAVFV